MNSMVVWVGFIVIVAVMLAVDLGALNRNAHEISMREAVKTSLLWIGLALLFNLGLYFIYGSEKALQFLTGYLVEESLSVDNLFVFLLLFQYFGVPAAYRHKVLFWGIVGAVVMRGIFIAAGVTLIHRFHWIIYIFGAFLVYTGIKLVQEKERQVHPEKNPVIKLLRRVIPVMDQYHGDHFFVKAEGRRWATPLFVVLLAVETTDIIFAVDSIPAVLAITTDPLIVFTSNIFAILGLRALFFVLEGFMQKFQYLSYGLAGILVFIGAKMLVVDFYKLPVGLTLGVIAAVLLISVMASARANGKLEKR